MPFTTFKPPHPQSRFTSLTIGGAADAAETNDVLTTTGAVSWLNLLPTAGDSEFSRATLESRGVAVRVVPVVAPHGLTLDVSRNLLAALKEMPSGSL